MNFADKLNAWLTPTHRKVLHGAIALVAAVLGIWGFSTHTIDLWVAVVIAAGGAGDALLAAVVTHRPDLAWIYSGAVGLVAALVGVRVFHPEFATQMDATLAAVVTFLSSWIFTRTDTSTSNGAPSYEVPGSILPNPAVTVNVAGADPAAVAAHLSAALSTVSPTVVSNPDRSITSQAADGTITNTPGV